jgi:hypothetical protein
MSVNHNPSNDQAAKIDAVLRKNAGTLHLVNVPRTPLEELLRGEEMWDDAEERELREEERVATFRRMLEFIFQSGPEPLRVLRNIFALTKAVRPELLGDMSLDDIAIICADGGKATVSARIERIYNATLEKAGVTAPRAAFQKRSSKYSAAQAGNKNRVKGRKKRG